MAGFLRLILSRQLPRFLSLFDSSFVMPQEIPEPRCACSARFETEDGLDDHIEEYRVKYAYHSMLLVD
jgi:hypothetical protein